MLEFYLKQGKKIFQFPVSPSSYNLKLQNNNTTIVVESVGEVNILGDSKLSEITLSGFFPAQEYNFCAYSNIPTPEECVDKIIKFKKSKKPVRLIITDTTINDLFSIESFEYGENDGTGDITFSIALRQYKVLNLNQKQVGQWDPNYNFSFKDSNSKLV